jgi:hypothetical protein
MVFEELEKLSLWERVSMHIVNEGLCSDGALEHAYPLIGTNRHSEGVELLEKVKENVGYVVNEKVRQSCEKNEYDVDHIVENLVLFSNYCSDLIQARRPFVCVLGDGALSESVGCEMADGFVGRLPLVNPFTTGVGGLRGYSDLAGEEFIELQDTYPLVDAISISETIEEYVGLDSDEFDDRLIKRGKIAQLIDYTADYRRFLQEDKTGEGKFFQELENVDYKIMN